MIHKISTTMSITIRIIINTAITIDINPEKYLVNDSIAKILGNLMHN